MRMMCSCPVRTEMVHLRYMYETQVLLGTAHRARARGEKLFLLSPHCKTE